MGMWSLIHWIPGKSLNQSLDVNNIRLELEDFEGQVSTRQSGEKEKVEGPQLALIKMVSEIPGGSLPPKPLPILILEKNREKQEPFLRTVGYAEFSGGVPGAYLNCDGR